MYIALPLNQRPANTVHFIQTMSHTRQATPRQESGFWLCKSPNTAVTLVCTLHLPRRIIMLKPVISTKTLIPALSMILLLILRKRRTAL